MEFHSKVLHNAWKAELIKKNQSVEVSFLKKFYDRITTNSNTAHIRGIPPVSSSKNSMRNQMALDE